MAKKFNIHDWQAKQRLLEVNEGHGLEADDLEQLKIFTDNLPEDTISEKAIKRILNFLIKSNIKVDQTKDLSKNKNEASATGTGASFTAGSGEGYMSPNAFGDDKRKKRKAYMGYKEI